MRNHAPDGLARRMRGNFLAPTLEAVERGERRRPEFGCLLCPCELLRSLAPASFTAFCTIQEAGLANHTLRLKPFRSHLCLLGKNFERQGSRFPNIGLRHSGGAKTCLLKRP